MWRRVLWDVFKELFFIVFLLGAVYYVAGLIDYKERTKEWLMAQFQQAGYTVSSLDVAALTPLGVEIENFRMLSPWHFSAGLLRVDLMRRQIDIQNLEIPQAWGEVKATFNGSAWLRLQNDNVVFNGILRGQPSNLSVDYIFTAPLIEGEKATMKIERARFTYAGGQISARDIVYTPQQEEPIPLSVEFESLELQTILQNMMHPAVKATGKVSGKLPMMMDKSGQLSLGRGKLSAIEGGQLQVPKDVFPEASPEMQQVSRALADFYYTELDIISRASTNGGGMVLSLVGSSPEINGGQPVKLEVNLSGTVVQFVHRQMMSDTRKQPE